MSKKGKVKILVTNYMRVQMLFLLRFFYEVCQRKPCSQIKLFSFVCFWGISEMYIGMHPVHHSLTKVLNAADILRFYSVEFTNSLMACQ